MIVTTRPDLVLQLNHQEVYASCLRIFAIGVHISEPNCTKIGVGGFDMSARSWAGWFCSRITNRHVPELETGYPESAYITCVNHLLSVGGLWLHLLQYC